MTLRNYLNHLVKLTCVAVFLSLSQQLYAQTDSLYKTADVVCVAEITSISPPFSSDLGTEHFYVSVQIHDVFKQRIPFEKEDATLHWIVSNLRCDSTPLSSCITQYQDGEWIFYLKREHFYEGEEMSPAQVQALDNQTLEQLTSLQKASVISISHSGKPKTCSPNCDLCKHVAKQNWASVKKYMKRNANDSVKGNWSNHRRIKWVLPDRYILASLPSYQSVRFLFQTDEEDVEVLVNFQIGYYKTYFRWIPNVLYSLFNAQAYGFFSREDVDKLTLKSFEVNAVTSPAYMAFEYEQFNAILLDSLQIKNKDQCLPLTQELALYASAYEGFTPYYNISKYEVIDSLFAQRKVYTLCIMAHYGRPEIATYAIEKLGQLNNQQAIPFLIELAEYEANFPGNSQYRQSLRKALISSLDQLTGITSLGRVYPYTNPNTVRAIEDALPLWQSRFVVMP